MKNIVLISNLYKGFPRLIQLELFPWDFPGGSVVKNLPAMQEA